jgi:hypothetical protein
MTRRSTNLQQPNSTAHQRDIEALAREAHVPVEEVTQLYAYEWAALAARARITSFLPILTTRKVRAILQKRHAPRPALVEGGVPVPA